MAAGSKGDGRPQAAAAAADVTRRMVCGGLAGMIAKVSSFSTTHTHTSARNHLVVFFLPLSFVCDSHCLSFSLSLSLCALVSFVI